MWKTRLAAYLVFYIYRMVQLTWRLEVVESDSFRTARENGEPITIAHWHNDIIPLYSVIRRYRIASMISQSKDGDIAAYMAHLGGAKSARGSSTRGGGGALKSIIELGFQGWNPAIAVDGPKGPRHKVKSGIFEVSRATQSKIFPVAMAMNRAFVFEKAWDKSVFPKPFARVICFWGDGLPAVPKEGDSKNPRLGLELEAALTDAEQRAFNLVATRPFSATVNNK